MVWVDSEDVAPVKVSNQTTGNSVFSTFGDKSNFLNFENSLEGVSQGSLKTG